MSTHVYRIISLLMLLSSCTTQYNILRVNPFEQLSTTLKTHQVEECDGATISLNCPQGTKVCCNYLNIFSYDTLLILDFYNLCLLWNPVQQEP